MTTFANMTAFANESAFAAMMPPFSILIGIMCPSKGIPCSKSNS